MASKLVDSHGRPVEVGVLEEEVAAPVLTGLRNPWWQSIANVLTPELLGEILSSTDQGVSWQYLVLAYELEDRWARYYSVLSTRKLAVAGMSFSVDAGGEDAQSKKVADFVRDVLSPKRITSLVTNSLDALSKGYSCLEIMWDKEGATWWPREFKYRDARFFRYDLLTGQELRIYDMKDPGFGIPIPPFKFVVHQPEIKCGLPIKRGLARLALVPYMCQNYGIRDWMAFAETMGMPLRYGKHEPTASADERKALLKAVAGIGTDYAAIIPKNMEIEFEARGTTSGGDKIFQGMVGYFNEEMTIAVLGQPGSTQAVAGKLGNDDSHENVRDDIRVNDALQMEATIDRDIIKPIVDLNFGPQPEGKYPTSNLRAEKPEDQNQTATALAVYIDRGLRVREQDIRAKFKGLEEPEEGDAVLTPAKSGGGVGQDDGGLPKSGPVAHSEEGLPKPSPELPTDSESKHNPDDAEKKALKKPAVGKAKASVERLIEKASRGQALTADERLALTAAVSGRDGIDDMSDEYAGQWRKVVDPMREQVAALAQSCTTADEFKAKLAKLHLDKRLATELVAEATFKARVIGQHKDQP
jgi:phage gp29-like protein